MTTMRKKLIWAVLALFLTVPAFAQQTAQTTLQLIVTAPVTITTSTLPPCTVGIACTFTLSASGGTIPYTYSFPSGVFLPGMAINKTTGVFTWTPTASQQGAASQGFMVTDAKGLTNSKWFTVTVNPSAVVPLVTTTTSLPGASVGTAYSATLTATGGTTPYSWSLTAGTLPSGLSLSAAGVISGTPTVATPAVGVALTFTVKDSSGAIASLNVTFMAAASGPIHSVDVTWTPSSVPGVVGVNVYKAASSSGPWTRNNAIPVTVQPYIDSVVKAGETDFYALTSVVSGGRESAFSAVASATIPTP